MSVVTENKAIHSRELQTSALPPLPGRAISVNALSTVSNDLKTFFGNNRKLHQGQTCILI